MFALKYVSLVKQAFIKAITYRSEVFLWFVLDITPILVLLLVWASMYANRTELGGYSFIQMVQYYFLATMINLITEAHFEASRVEEIRKGKIDFYLTRPFNYLAEIWCSFIGTKLYYTLTSGGATVLLYVVMTHFFALTPFNVNMSAAIQFFILLLIAQAISFFLSLLIVMTGFWSEHAEGLQHFKWIVVTLLSGWMVPFSLMPLWLRNISELLPLKFLYAMPIGIIQGTRNMLWPDWLYLIIFTLGLWVLSVLTWKKAQLQYTSQGG